MVSTGAVIAATTSDWAQEARRSRSALVELAQERLLLELGQLERLGDLREIGRRIGPDLLGLLEQLPDVLDDEDLVDVNLCHAPTVTRFDERGEPYSLASAALCLGVGAKCPR